MAGWMQVIIIGNLGNDPELKYLQSGTAVANFSVAVNTVSGQGENKAEETEWFRVAAWRELGERCNQYLRKGRQVMVVGTLKKREYVDANGKHGASLDLTAREVRFLGSRDAGDEDTQHDYQPIEDIAF